MDLAALLLANDYYSIGAKRRKQTLYSNKKTCLKATIIAVEDVPVVRVNHMASSGSQPQRRRCKPFVYRCSNSSSSACFGFVSVDNLRLNLDKETNQFCNHQNVART